MAFDWATLRGFNYMPSYSGNLQYTWTNFDLRAWEAEVPYARRFGSNALRIWLDWHAFLCAESQTLNAIDMALDILERNDLRMIPVLFNRWTDPRYPAGGISTENLSAFEEPEESPGTARFRPYVDSILDRYAEDPRIILWDLCNEPLSPHCVATELETRWLTDVAGWIRARSDIPITIGTMRNEYFEHWAPLVDVLSLHAYPRAIGEMSSICESHLALARSWNKPLIVTETCVGSLDDAERAALARDSLETLDRFGIGWQAWHLCSGALVTASRERTDSNSVRPEEGYMAFVLPNGQTRPYHEWLEVE